MEAEFETQQALLKFKRLFGILLVVLVGLVFINSRFFAIKTVQIEGNHLVTKEDMLMMAAVNLHQNIFQVDRDKLRQAILADPRIAAVTVGWRLPGTLIIKVRERKPACLLLYSNNRLVIADDGMVLGMVSDRDSAKLPLVVGIRFKKVKVGERLRSRELEAALSVIAAADPSLERLLDQIDLRTYQLRLVLPNSQHQINVELGDASDLETKLANLRAVLAHSPLQGLDQIDLRVIDLPTVITGKK